MNIFFLIIGVIGTMGLIIALLYVMVNANKTSSIANKNKAIITDARERYVKVEDIQDNKDKFLFAFDDAEILVETYFQTIKERYILLLISIIASCLGFMIILFEFVQKTEIDSHSVGKLITGFLQVSFYFLLKNKDAEVKENKLQMLKAKRIVMELEVISNLSANEKIDNEIIKTLDELRKII